MSKTLRTTLSDKLKVKRIVKKRKPTIGQKYQTEKKVRSSFEGKVCDLMDKYQTEYSYEDRNAKLKYVQPAKNRSYLSDFIITCQTTGVKYFIETKGRFHTTDERTKYLLIAEQNPDIKLVLCFMNPSLPITKGSKTTYKMFFDKHNIANIDFKQLDKLLRNYRETKKFDLSVLL